MTVKKAKSMSREEAAELYRDLKKAMSTVKAKGGSGGAKSKGAAPSVGEMIAREISKAMKKDDASAPSSAPRAEAIVGEEIPSESVDWPSRSNASRGRNAAIGFVIFVAAFKTALSAMEAVGFATASPVQAAMVSAPASPRLPTEAFSREEIKVLTSLDARRAELEERSRKIEERSRDLDTRDREFVSRLTELRELNDKLGAERDRSQRKRSSQLEQLANVYGSMNPSEAAKLIEQLDVAIALGLIEKMPEKRIGQILAMMSPERALALTRLLSGKANP